MLPGFFLCDAFPPLLRDQTDLVAPGYAGVTYGMLGQKSAILAGRAMADFSVAPDSSSPSATASERTTTRTLCKRPTSFRLNLRSRGLRRSSICASDKREIKSTKPGARVSSYLFLVSFRKRRSPAPKRRATTMQPRTNAWSTPLRPFSGEVAGSSLENGRSV